MSTSLSVSKTTKQFIQKGQVNKYFVNKTSFNIPCLSSSLLQIQSVSVHFCSWPSFSSCSLSPLRPCFGLPLGFCLFVIFSLQSWSTPWSFILFLHCCFGLPLSLLFFLFAVVLAYPLVLFAISSLQSWSTPWSSILSLHCCFGLPLGFLCCLFIVALVYSLVFHAVFSLQFWSTLGLVISFFCT